MLEGQVQKTDREWKGEKTKEVNKGKVMTTNLVDQELELDDSSTALVLTVALHTSTAKAARRLSQRKLDGGQ